jgi:hypothetical protein
MWSNNSGMSSMALCFYCVFGSCLIRILNGMQINLTDIFMLFLSNSTQILWQYLQLGQNHFLTHASTFFSRSLICATDIEGQAEKGGGEKSPTHNIIHIQAHPQYHSDTSPTTFLHSALQCGFSQTSFHAQHSHHKSWAYVITGTLNVISSMCEVTMWNCW